MQSLVTGATGFLGRRLARVLSERGDRVRALVRPTCDRRRVGGSNWSGPNGEVTDRALVQRAVCVRGTGFTEDCAARRTRLAGGRRGSTQPLEKKRHPTVRA